jgi:hypothetical protein
MKPRIGGGNAWPGNNLSALAVSFLWFCVTDLDSLAHMPHRPIYRMSGNAEVFHGGSNFSRRG